MSYRQHNPAMKETLSWEHPYIQAIITQARQTIASGGNTNLFKGAVSLANLLPHGFVSEHELTETALNLTSQSRASALATIRSAIRTGRNRPLDLDKISPQKSPKKSAARFGQPQNSQTETRSKAKKQAALEQQGKREKRKAFQAICEQQGHAVEGTAAQYYLEKRGIWPCDTSTMVFLASYPHWQEVPQENGSMVWVKTFHPSLAFIATKIPDSQIKSGLVLSLDNKGNKAKLTKIKNSTGQLVNDARRFAPLFGGLGYWTGNRNSTVLILCEGAENAHSIALMRHDTPLICAALSSVNMPNITPPPQIKKIVLAGDNDKAGQEANAKAAQQYLTAGYEVKTITPPPDLDWNDLLLMQIKGGLL